MNETTSNDNEITPEIKSDNILDNNISQELKTEINESVQSIDKSKINENISSTNNTADINDNKKIEEENVTDIKVNDESNNMEKTDISEKVDEDDEELEIQNLPKPSSHCYSYNITNLSNNREDLGAGFRSRLRNINSPTRTTSTSTTTTSTSYSYTNNNVNPHPSYNPSSVNKKTTTTTTSTTSSTTTSTTTTTHIPSIKIKDDIKIPDNNSTSYKSSQESSIPNPTSSSTNTPKPTPTTQSNNINNNTNKNHTTDNNNNNNDSSSSSAAAGKQEATNEEDEEEKNRHMFECNICLDTASDPVVTMCGHFYCWPCIAMWLERSNQCPVCKSGISKEKIIPVYARGAERKDPREKDIPHRPAGHREEPEPRRRSPFNFQTSFSTFGLFPGFSFTFSNGGNQAGFNQGGFFNPFNLGPEFPQPESQSRTGHGQGQNGQNGQGGQGGGDPNDYQNYILSAFLFFIVFSILSSILFK